MIATQKTNPQIIAGTISHWRREIDSTLSQIHKGDFPAHDGNCRQYIKLCRRHIQRLKAIKNSLK
jgi:hypothetical protein